MFLISYNIVSIKIGEIMKSSRKTAIYAGTFDPITNGHMDLIERASGIFDGVLVALGKNAKKEGNHLFKMIKRFEMVSEATKHLDNVTVATFEGLLVNYASRVGVDVIIRRLRTCSDFEHEFQMVKTNRRLNSDIETVFLTPKAETEFISSSVVKEIWYNDGDITGFVPENVREVLGRLEHGVF